MTKGKPNIMFGLFFVGEMEEKSEKNRNLWR